MTTALSRVWLTKHVQTLRLDIDENGIMTVPSSLFVSNSTIFSAKLIHPVASTSPAEELARAQNYSRFLTLHVVLKACGSVVGPIAVGGSDRLDVGASAFGSEHKGEVGIRMRFLEDYARANSGGTSDTTRGRWGLNVTHPNIESIQLRFGPFPPPCQRVMVQFKSWVIIEEEPDGSLTTLPQ